MSDPIAALVSESRAARMRAVLRVAAIAFPLYWVLDAAIGAALSGGYDFLDRLLHPTALEIGVRLLVTALVALLYRVRQATARMRLLSSALEAAPDGIQIADLHGRIGYSNPAVQTIYGFSPADLLGHNVGEMNADPTIAGRLILPALQRTGSWAGELEVKHKSGGTFPIWLTTSIVRDRHGAPTASVGVIRDLSERRRAEQELRRYAEQLEEATRLKDLFADILRHDLLGPASAVQLSLDTLQRHTAGTLPDAKLLASARRSCGRLTEMIEAAATYAKLSAATQIEFGRIDLGALLATLPTELDVPLAERPAHLVLPPGGAAYPARANPIVALVFTNLVSNAIKYGPPGGTIEVAIRDQGDRWQVSVADSGEGIPDADKERVFTRFERLAKEGVKGSGLGLAIARRIVDLHGGRIWIEDNPGGGAVFCVALPKA
ncbi:PAS domain-containing sensor histidine kinase [Anaeromyxobacter oryzisoli]|uniref:PAS domain-containing sensor histidine kinase n=1 Tax=Anaeromyxobacter oryzisoli TaxID=2925408 RepID=UPI001F56B9DA|nr:PAS domain-containing sensor histidine kinase [Anaeromyxobacter sp. SG63]